MCFSVSLKIQDSHQTLVSRNGPQTAQCAGLREKTRFRQKIAMNPKSQFLSVQSVAISIISKIELLRIDTTIAAMCITYDLTLLTGNTVDFKGIAHLKIINPW